METRDVMNSSIHVLSRRAFKWGGEWVEPRAGLDPVAKRIEPRSFSPWPNHGTELCTPSSAQKLEERQDRVTA